MTASSQTPGALPPVQHDPRPLQAAIASYATVHPAPAGPADPEPPAAATTPTAAIAAVIDAEMSREGAASPEAIAAAELRAGVAFDPVRYQAAIDAHAEQIRTECAAEITALRQDAATAQWFHARWAAVGRLCEGRALDDLLKVSDVLAAAENRTPTALPLTLRWDGQVTGPAGDGPGEVTLVHCITARGGRAVVALDDSQRCDLGGRLLANLHTAEACHTPGCGRPADQLDPSDPAAYGWVCVGVAGTEDGPRWWCDPLCASAAMAAARAELHADELAAAADPAQQAPAYGGDPLAYGPTGIRCGCGKDAHSNLVPCQPDHADTTSPAGQTGGAW